MSRGLRPLPSQSRDDFPQIEIEKMAKRIERILADSQIPDEQGKWLIDQALLVVTYRQALTAEEKNRITRDIDHHEKKGYRLGLRKKEIRAINRVVVQKDRGNQLEEFCQRLLGRREN
jgi:hypothetical protein